MNGQKPRPPKSWGDDNNGDSSGSAAAASKKDKVDMSGDEKPGAGETVTEH
jgi:hypothetical protein